MVEIKKKKVDEAWKKKVQKEKETVEKKTRQTNNQPYQEASFLNIINIFVSQAMMQLGNTEHPFTGQRMLDLAGAKYSLDTLEILKNKTKGNLTTEEQSYLDKVLSELKMAYVMRSGGVS